MSSATPERVLDAARARGLTIACAESLTGGLLCSSLVSVPGASDVVRGGVIAYTAEIKTSVLGVPAELITERGVVSNEVAVAMAEGARRVFGADVGVATTGVAGPEAHGGRPPGTVWIAVVAPQQTTSRGLAHAGSRENVRRATVDDALDALLHALGETP